MAGIGDNPLYYSGGVAPGPLPSARILSTEEIDQQREKQEAQEEDPS